MKIQIFEPYCPQLSRNVRVALDVEAEDPYRNTFKEAFNVPMELRFLLESRAGVDLFLDVGANLGHFSISAGLMGIRTIAIEAMAGNYLLLTRSLSANSLENVIPFHLAASDGFFPVALQSHGAWANVSNTGTGDTPALPLDQLLSLADSAAPDLIKLDVEGHEIRALRGLAKSIETFRPMLIFEGNNWTARFSGGYLRLLDEVASMGYDLFLFNRDGTIYPVSPITLQDVVCVDYFAHSKGVAARRSRPKIRHPSVEERISRVEADVDAGEPHRWHIASIIDRFEAEVGSSGRVDAIRNRLAQFEAKGHVP